MSSGMFRDKDSSNRIELSRLVQELLNFGVLGSLWLSGVGGWVDGGGGCLGDVPYTCAHACACTHAHTGVVNMIISCKWPPLLADFLGIPYDVICARVCMCLHACACAHWWGYPLTTPTHIHPPPAPQGGTPRTSQNSIALELIKIFQFRLKI